MFSFQESLSEVVRYIKSGRSLEDFETLHGIASKTDGKHLILDYDQITVKWAEPYGYSCRGLVLDVDTLDVLAAPLKKFFNCGETYADSINWNSAKVFEKIDGTMINRWWSPHSKQFEYSTRFQLPTGLETTSVNSGMMTWRSMIDRCMKSVDQDFLRAQPKDQTWTFEVCSPHNMVVVRHTEFFAKLLAIKSNSSFKEFSVEVSKHSPKSYSFASARQVLDFANQHPAVDLEGFVVVDDSFNRIKIKSDQYVQLHRLKDGLNSINNIILLARNSDFEEVVTHFPQYKPDLCAAQSLIEQIISEHDDAFSRLRNIENQKEFAIAVNSLGIAFPGALFSTRAGKHKSIKEALFSMPDPAFCRLVKPRLIVILDSRYSPDDSSSSV